MAINISPNMFLPVPGVGTENGPQYAQDVNNCLTIIDAHDHTPGSGVQITPLAMDINTDLAFGDNNITNARSVRFTAQLSPLALPTDLGSLYEAGVDLYFNDGSGNQIRITQSGGIAGTPGSISNLTSPATASYVAGNSTFVWQSAALTPANMDAASYILRNLSASSYGLTLAPPTLASDYQITLPQLPASTLPLVMNSAGAMSTSLIAFNQLATAVQVKISTVPTIQKFLSGTGTYTLPTSPATPLYIRVRAVGGGGGGCGPFNPTSAGGTTTFGTSLITCTGGAAAVPGGSVGGTGGVGGTATATGLSGVVQDGANGQGGSGIILYVAGGSGASSPFGGGGGGGAGNSLGSHAAANSGSGGGGGGQGNSGGSSGGGGGAGGYVDVIIPTPSATYAYAVGAAGAGGSGGGNGAAGQIIVEEYYC